MTAKSIGAPDLLPAGADLSGTRRRLFETALLQFGEQGYHAVSVRDLATALGLQPGAIYTHVSSKQQLLYELVEMGHRYQRDLLEDVLLGTGPDPVEQVRALARAHVLLHLRYRELAGVTHREFRSLTVEQQQQLYAIRGETERMFLNVIERGVRLGSFTVSDPWLSVAAIGAMGIRAAEWWTPQAPFDADKVADTFAGFAIALLTRQS
ncbi:TetR/AcrR family transcriptional regulator [Nocardia sp. NPDC005978]|uniref:TetR/AcrR family transcriptional regulator n=1 Tax=Nocardia sp. NPDC005978 TaxID=3156725 RepID=UPI0033B3FDEC